MPSHFSHALRDTWHDPVVHLHWWMAWYAIVWVFLAGFVYIILLIDYQIYLREQEDEELVD